MTVLDVFSMQAHPNDCPSQIASRVMRAAKSKRYFEFIVVGVLIKKYSNLVN